MTKILALLNSSQKEISFIRDEVEKLGMHIVFDNPHTHRSVLKTSGHYDGLIILGGYMGVMDNQYSDIFQEISAVIHDFHNNKKPIMGFCLGAQIIAHSFGGTVKRIPEYQMGFKPTRMTPQGLADNLLSSSSEMTKMLFFNEDAFDLPESATRLIESDNLPNVAFRLGLTTYGFQSHIEANIEALDEWFDTDKQYFEARLAKTEHSNLGSFRDLLKIQLQQTEKARLSIMQNWIKIVIAQSVEREPTCMMP